MRVTVSAAVLALGVAQASAFAVLPPASLGTFSQDSAGCVRGAWSRGQRRSSRSLLRVPRLLMCLVQGQRARAGRGRGARDGRVFTVYLQCWECPSVPTRSLLRVLSCSAWEQGLGFPNGLGCRALTVCVSLCFVVFAHWGGPLHGGAGGKERMSSIDTHGASTCGSACSCKRGAQSRAVASGWRNWPTTGRPARDIAARCAVLAGARGYLCWRYRRVPIA